MNNCVVFCLVHKEGKKGKTRVEKKAAKWNQAAIGTKKKERSGKEY
jgi:hypothetical protein